MGVKNFFKKIGHGCAEGIALFFMVLLYCFPVTIFNIVVWFVMPPLWAGIMTIILFLFDLFIVYEDANHPGV